MLLQVENNIPKREECYMDKLYKPYTVKIDYK